MTNWQRFKRLERNREMLKYFNKDVNVLHDGQIVLTGKLVDWELHDFTIQIQVSVDPLKFQLYTFDKRNHQLESFSLDKPKQNLVMGAAVSLPAAPSFSRWEI